MCAIFGIIGQFCSNKAKNALSTMSHRGPDHCGIIEKERLFFSHLRLSIHDHSHSAHQPISHNKILLSFNGEIYNFKELKAELEFEYKSNSDTEVILAAYLKWGVSFVDHLRGMFAIAIYDDDTLYLFRDRAGKKPLFYYQDEERFIFSSEIKAIKPFLKNLSLNEDALLSYLSFLAPTPPHTFYKNIYKLPSSHFLTLKNGTISIKRYDDFLLSSPNQINSLNEAIERLDEMLHQTISLRLQSDTSIASLLSGGIDSSLIAAIAKKQGHSLQTYTLGYKEYKNYDECDDAAQSAAFIGVENRSIIIDQSDFIGVIDEVLESFDEPLNDPASVPLYLLFREIKKDNHKVVLSGEGSDELFLGYRRYFDYLDLDNLPRLKSQNWLKKYFSANFSINLEWEWHKRVFSDQLLFRTSGEKFTDLQKNIFLNKNIKDNDSMRYLQSYRDHFDKSAHHDHTSWYSYIDLELFQAEHFLTKLDRTSMAHSIEARTPFLDQELIKLSFMIKPELKYEDRVTKSLLKKLASSYLSEDIINKKKKGFSNPYMEYLENSKKISLIQEVNEKTDMFKKDVLKRFISESKSGKFKHHIWGLFVLSKWIEKNLL